MSVKSKRLRFEILKRDGFRCRYCGATAVGGAVLHVDHVQPESAGGDDSPENLVTACVACNGGKSNIGLDDSLLSSATAEEMRQNAEDIRAYLASCLEQRQAQEAVRQVAYDHYFEVVGPHVGDKISLQLEAALMGLVQGDGLLAVLKAMDITAWKASSARMNSTDAAKYFYGVMKRMRVESAPAPSEHQRYRPIDNGSDPMVIPYARRST